MQADNLVEPIPTCGRDLAWQLTPQGAARDEIDSLTALLALPAATPLSMQPPKETP